MSFKFCPKLSETVQQVMINCVCFMIKKDHSLKWNSIIIIKKKYGIIDCTFSKRVCIQVLKQVTTAFWASFQSSSVNWDNYCLFQLSTYGCVTSFPIT